MICKKILVPIVGWLETGRVALVGNRKVLVGKISVDNGFATVGLKNLELVTKNDHGVFDVPTAYITDEPYLVYTNEVLFYEEIKDGTEDDSKDVIKPETVEDIINNIKAGEVNKVMIDKPLTVTDSSIVEIPEGTTLNVILDDTVTCEAQAFNVKDGGKLVLSGSGTIKSSKANTRSAIDVDGENAVVVLDGVTIDCVSDCNDPDNYHYGVGLSNGATLNMHSGTIHTSKAAAISTNNTTSNGVVNINGGKLLSDYTYALYFASQDTININAGEIEGISVRMGTVNINGGKITLKNPKENLDEIGSNIKTTGIVKFGDTIEVMSGTYNSPEGNFCNINIGKNATVESNYRAAVGVYMLDTKYDENVNIEIESMDSIKTTDSTSEVVKVYDHEYLTNEATSAGKKYSPVSQSTVTIKGNGIVIYPVA